MTIQPPPELIVYPQITTQALFVASLVPPNVRPCVTGRYRHSSTQQTQQQARTTDILGIVALSYKVYSPLVSFRERFCLPCNTTV
jgi:hypothetical protein